MENEHEHEHDHMHEHSHPHEHGEGSDHDHWHYHGKMRHMKHHGAMGGAYFLGFLGALVYFIQQATSFGMGLLGFLKALIWPALLVYNLLGHLGM